MEKQLKFPSSDEEENCSRICGFPVKKKWPLFERLVEVLIQQLHNYPSNDKSTHRHWDNVIWQIMSANGCVVITGIWIFDENNEPELSWSSPFATIENLRGWIVDFITAIRQKIRVCIHSSYHQNYKTSNRDLRQKYLHIHIRTRLHLGQSFELTDEHVGCLEKLANESGRKIRILNPNNNQPTVIHLLPTEATVT